MDSKESLDDIRRLPGEPTRPNLPDRAPTQSPLVRAGYWALAGSIGVTLTGTILLAQGETSLQTTASAIHQVGTLLMLVSCAIMLLGYRMSRLERPRQTRRDAKEGRDM